MRTVLVGVPWAQPPWKAAWRCLGRSKTHHPMAQQVHSGHLPEEDQNANSKRQTHCCVHCGIASENRDIEAAHVPKR